MMRLSPPSMRPYVVVLVLALASCALPAGGTARAQTPDTGATRKKCEVPSPPDRIVVWDSLPVNCEINRPCPIWFALIDADGSRRVSPNGWVFEERIDSGPWLGVGNPGLFDTVDQRPGYDVGGINDVKGLYSDEPEGFDRNFRDGRVFVQNLQEIRGRYTMCDGRTIYTDVLIAIRLKWVKTGPLTYQILEDMDRP